MSAMQGSVPMDEHLLLLVFEPTLMGAPFASTAATCSTALVLGLTQALSVRHPVSMLRRLEIC